ncbi:MAG TPA: hypothetical protein VKU60_15795, partial [Chloroflexota bacterium]|nr:hypothetical protein [Chloroflexota bacterium]
FLQSAFTPRLAGPAGFEIVVVLLMSRAASAQFDELTQTLTWPLADAKGRWVGLALRYEGHERARLEALERLTQTERFWAVLATAQVQDSRIELQPYALWGTGTRLLDFSPAPANAAPREDGLIDRLRRLTRRSSRDAKVMLWRQTATEALLERGWNALLRRAEVGDRLAGETLAEEALELSNAIEAAGLIALASQLRPLAGLSTGGAGAYLRAAYAIRTFRMGHAELAWMG